MESFELSDKQRKLIKEWINNNYFWNELSTNQRDILLNILRKRKYTMRDRDYVLNRVREKWKMKGLQNE